MLAQRTPHSSETRPSTSAGVFNDFLTIANEAHRAANDEQRRLMRQLASTHPTPQDAAAGIRQIMGWS